MQRVAQAAELRVHTPCGCDSEGPSEVTGGLGDDSAWRIPCAAGGRVVGRGAGAALERVSRRRREQTGHGSKVRQSNLLLRLKKSDRPSDRRSRPQAGRGSSSLVLRNQWRHSIWRVSASRCCMSRAYRTLGLSWTRRLGPGGEGDGAAAQSLGEKRHGCSLRTRHGHVAYPCRQLMLSLRRRLSLRMDDIVSHWRKSILSGI